MDIKPKILVVDDSEFIVELIVTMLKNTGYVISKAYDGKQALEMIDADKPDLIILDVLMPKMTGFDLAEEILKIQPDIPIILFTGFTDEDDFAHARRIGIKTILTKPIEQKILARTIRNILDKPEPI